MKKQILFVILFLSALKGFNQSTTSQFSIIMQGKWNGEIVDLSWKDVSGYSFPVFEIQRSVDGITFDKIGEVAFGGTYKFSDSNSPEMEKIFYRLQGKRPNGMLLTSNVVQMNKIVGVHINVYPNPVTSSLKVNIHTQSAQQSTTRLYDLSGKMIRQWNHQLPKGGAQVRLGMESLKKGIYVLEVQYEKLYRTTIVK